MVGRAIYERVNTTKFLRRGRRIRIGGRETAMGEEGDEDRG